MTRYPGEKIDFVEDEKNIQRKMILMQQKG